MMIHDGKSVNTSEQILHHCTRLCTLFTKLLFKFYLYKNCNYLKNIYNFDPFQSDLSLKHQMWWAILIPSKNSMPLI